MDPLRVWAVVWARLQVATRHREERGDVPGWVLVTVMTITVGMGLFAMARPMLTDMLRSALDSVK